MGTRPDPDHEPSFATYLPLVCLFAAANFLIAPLVAHAGSVGQQIIALLAVPTLGAQLCLVATWGVFGSASFPARLVRCAALGCASYICLFVGVRFAALTSNAEPDEPEVLLVLLTALPILFFGVQLPLWTLRLWLGWKVAKAGATSVGSYARPVMIKDLVLATAAVSVAMALVRLATLLVPLDAGGSEMLMGISFFTVGAAVVSLLTLPPLVFAVLGSRRPAAGAMGVAAWALGFIAVCSTAVILGTGLLPSPPQVAAITMVAVVFVALVASGLLLTRTAGYRLYWRPLRPATRKKLDREAARAESGY